MKFIRNLNKVNKKDVNVAGGKGANLGEMMKINIPVPPGFVILATAFDKFSEAKKIPKDLEKEIMSFFDKLNDKYVAVRSSATAEDSKTSSWAGELETYLNTTKKNLIKNIKKCWASLFSSRAISYRIKRGLRNKKISVAVVVQKMIQSEVSGVCFTANPITKNKNQMVVEAAKGLGDKLVQGEITPDCYILEKNNLGIISISSTKKQAVISRKQISKLADLCVRIENHYKKPQDIEWALKKNKFYILQSRPITTL